MARIWPCDLDIFLNESWHRAKDASYYDMRVMHEAGRGYAFVCSGQEQDDVIEFAKTTCSGRVWVVYDSVTLSLTRAYLSIHEFVIVFEASADAVLFRLRFSEAMT